MRILKKIVSIYNIKIIRLTRIIFSRIDLDFTVHFIGYRLFTNYWQV